MQYDLDSVVVGGGVVGISIARALALAGREVVVLEKEQQIALHTTSRNSEVVHAGIYYAPGSLKATLCLAGREMLYDYCEKRDVFCQKVGKLIVAVSDNEQSTLESYHALALANGVADIRFVDAGTIARLEPSVNAVSGLHSPSTGIVDSHEFLSALIADLGNASGQIVLRSEVDRVERRPRGFALYLTDDSQPVTCGQLINAGGLWAQDLMHRSELVSDNLIPPKFFAKAHYYSYSGKSPFSRLVYPIASSAGLGVHVTIDRSAAAKFGPDVQWVEQVNYDFDDARRADFVDAIRRYYPDLEEKRLTVGYTGIRPKIAGPGDPAADFCIQSEADHGVKGLVNLFGIESPGLTASLAIGRHVLERLFR